MGRRTLLAAVGWLATAVLATGLGLGAIRLVGEGIAGTPGGVLSQEEVARALASPVPSAPAVSGTPTGPGAPGAGPSGTPQTPTAVPSATPPVTPSASPAGSQRVFVVTGGSAVAECRSGGAAFLVSWSPAQGYRAVEIDRGPDDDVEVSFVGPGGEHELQVECVGGEPVLIPDDDDDDDD
ncbi:septum formation initiator [Micromonospora rosaria]|uniref:Septum formation initiator n=1 Tax=Micromonospora rosaria TaxID=47874 RepID=A0A136PWN3_9ACTN|nr:septum formation initiator [Micromonospora rosaria]KXK62757.1 septum formation initiator [Micromonospora rosaria]